MLFTTTGFCPWYFHSIPPSPPNLINAFYPSSLSAGDSAGTFPPQPETFPLRWALLASSAYLYSALISFC